MNRIRLGLIGLAAAAVLATGCFRNTVSEIELDVPAMRTPAAARTVEAAIARLGLGEAEPIRRIRTDPAVRKAWVTYDNVRLGRRNIEVAVRHAGFAVNDLPADERVRATLPPEFRGDE